MIKVQNVQNAQEGVSAVKKFLYETCDNNTVLFLSGGITPQALYEQLAIEEKLTIGAAGMVDERFGKKYHEGSNERMIKDSGLLQYLETFPAPFFPILQNGLSREKTAEKYNETVRFLLSEFSKSIAILGIGKDGHTAGLPAGIQNSVLRENSGSSKLRIKNDRLVAGFDDFPGPQKERITMTFEGLSKLDWLFVLAFGEEKKEALVKTFQKSPPAGGELEIPARFYTRVEIAPKTLLITDQKV